MLRKADEAIFLDGNLSLEAQAMPLLTERQTLCGPELFCYASSNEPMLVPVSLDFAVQAVVDPHFK